MPTVVFKGVAPNTFMSRAESHCVGGDGGEVGTSTDCGEFGTLSHENDDEGAGEGLGLSFSVMFGDGSE